MRMPPLRLVAESRRGFRVYLEIIAKGALVISEQSDKKWGLRESGLHTLDSHRIICAELMKSHRRWFQCPSLTPFLERG